MDLQVEKREILGKKVDFLRKQGLIPGELYGHGIPNLHLSIKAKDFERLFKEAGENTIINVKVLGVSHPSLIYDVQYDHLSGEAAAVDFYEVRMDEEIETMVPLKFIGESKVVKEGEGILIKAMGEIGVKTLPGDIPNAITVDISSLISLGQSIYVKDLPVSGKFKFTVVPATVVVSISAKAEEEVIVKPEVMPDQVAVETEEKKAAREATKSETGKTEGKIEKGKTESKGKIENKGKTESKGKNEAKA